MEQKINELMNDGYRLVNSHSGMNKTNIEVIEYGNIVLNIFHGIYD